MSRLAELIKDHPHLRRRVATLIRKATLPPDFPNSTDINFLVGACACIHSGVPVQASMLDVADKVASSLANHLGYKYLGVSDLPKLLIEARKKAAREEGCEALSTWVSPLSSGAAEG